MWKPERGVKYWESKGKSPKMFLQRIYVWSNFPLGIFKIFLNTNIIIIVVAVIINHWMLLSSHFFIKLKAKIHSLSPYIHTIYAILVEKWKKLYEFSWTWVAIKAWIVVIYIFFFCSTVVLTNRAITSYKWYEMKLRMCFLSLSKSYLSMSRLCLRASLHACLSIRRIY